MTTRQPYHADRCTRPQAVIVTGRLGDELLRCPECHRFRVVRPDKPEAEPAPKPVSKPHDALPVALPVPEATPTPTRTRAPRIVCRDHHDQSVDHRGRGCQKCEDERTPSKPRTQPLERAEADE